MTWRLLISFSLLIYSAIAADVSGTIELRDSRLDSVTRRHDYSGVVVSLAPVKSVSDPKPVARAQMTQKNKTFTPHVLPILTGTIVDFPNYDPIFHNAFSSYSGQVFDVGLYPPGTSRAVRFAKPGIVRVFCNIHPAMSAIIVVLDTPYFAKTAPDGAFKIDVPPGDYELNVFHERASESALGTLSRRVTVGAESVHLPALIISESGYLPVSHTNKYGKPYPPSTSDNSVYPGARN
jgi:plastocyanin